MKIGKYVDETVSTWQEQRPDLDFAPMGYMMRFHAMAEAAMDKIQIITKSHGLTVGEFDVLATLRRHGASSTLTPSYIAEVAMVSPSGLTHRLTQLEHSGHITRSADTSDRRSSLVSITKSGAAVADQIIELIAEQSAHMYNAISAKHLEQFNQVVALISTQLESHEATRPYAVWPDRRTVLDMATPANSTSRNRTTWSTKLDEGNALRPRLE